MLCVWPPFPIAITDYSDSMSGVDNIIAALEQRDRVCDITLDDIPGSKMDKLVPAMLGPFPLLEGIVLGAIDSEMAAVPDSFLCGSAPQLQWLTFHAIPFSAMPTLLFSARNLIGLQLSGIPRSGYISPEVMVTCLSAMPCLGNLRLQFDSSQSFPNLNNQHHHHLARSTLRALRELIIGGFDEYFEDFVARIDTPVMRTLEITFIERYFYDFSRLSQFICRVEVFKSLAHADIMMYNVAAEVSASLRTGTGGPAQLSLGISCNELLPRLQFFLAVCSATLLPFSNIGSLDISCLPQLQQSQGELFAGCLWLDLLRSFSTVKALAIDENSLTPIAYALKEVVEKMITEIFPAIQELPIGEKLPSGPILRVVEEFAAA